MITVEAARILRIDAGSLEPGKAADYGADRSARPNLIPTRKTNVVENLIWPATAARCASWSPPQGSQGRLPASHHRRAARWGR